MNHILDPVSKLAAAVRCHRTAASSLGGQLGLGEVDEDELYDALDWLLERQPRSRQRWQAAPHHGTLVLSVYRATGGTLLPLAKRGYSRDGKKGTLQIVRNACRQVLMEPTAGRRSARGLPTGALEQPNSCMDDDGNGSRGLRDCRPPQARILQDG